MTGPVLAPQDLADLVALEVQTRIPEATVAVMEHCEEHQTVTLVAGIQLAVVFQATDRATTVEAMPELTGRKVAAELERGLFEATRVMRAERDRQVQQLVGGRILRAFRDNEDMAPLIDALANGSLDVTA